MAISHTYHGLKEFITDDNYTRGKAIRAKCMDCTCWQRVEIRQCTIKKCPLYPYRMGSVSIAQQLEKLEPSLISGASEHEGEAGL